MTRRIENIEKDLQKGKITNPSDVYGLVTTQAIENIAKRAIKKIELQRTITITSSTVSNASARSVTRGGSKFRGKQRTLYTCVKIVHT